MSGKDHVAGLAGQSAFGVEPDAGLEGFPVVALDHGGVHVDGGDADADDAPGIAVNGHNGGGADAHQSPKMFGDLTLVEDRVADRVRGGVAARQDHGLDECGGGEGGDAEGPGGLFVEGLQDAGPAADEEDHRDDRQDLNNEQDDVNAADGPAAGDPFDALGLGVIDQVLVDGGVVGVDDPAGGPVGGDPRLTAADLALHQQFAQFVVTELFTLRGHALPFCRQTRRSGRRHS